MPWSSPTRFGEGSAVVVVAIVGLAEVVDRVLVVMIGVVVVVVVVVVVDTFNKLLFCGPYHLHWQIEGHTLSGVEQLKRQSSQFWLFLSKW